MRSAATFVAVHLPFRFPAHLHRMNTDDIPFEVEQLLGGTADLDFRRIAIDDEGVLVLFAEDGAFSVICGCKIT